MRLVDNSADCPQVRLSNSDLLDTAELLVNSVRLPFEGVDGLMIYGLRYKCASACPALHPHIPIQSPLVIDWVDKNSGKTLSGARYHYWNPVAAKRRSARWNAAPELIGRIGDGIEPRLSPVSVYFRFTASAKAST